MTQSKNEILASQAFDYFYNKLETLRHNVPRKWQKRKKFRSNYFRDTNQSQSPSNTVAEIATDTDVCRKADLENQISGNVKIDNEIATPDEVCKNTEIAKNYKSEKLP